MTARIVLVSRAAMMSGPGSWFIYHLPGTGDHALCRRTGGYLVDFEEMLHMSAGHTTRLCKWCERVGKGSE